LFYLTLLADAKTGRGTINAPTLRTWLPQLSEDAAKRVLTSLQRKRFIFREITPRSVYVYPYWIDAYIVSTGRLKSRQLCLSDVFDSNDIGAVKYTMPAPETALQGAPEGALETAPEGAHYNNNEKEKEKEKDKNKINKTTEPIRNYKDNDLIASIPEKSTQLSENPPDSSTRINTGTMNEGTQYSEAPSDCSAPEATVKQIVKQDVTITQPEAQQVPPVTLPTPDECGVYLDADGDSFDKLTRQKLSVGETQARMRDAIARRNATWRQAA